ncbi:hypothetical protein Gogos_006538 [Gossypium gossypioides]|uniref:Uncharacterized protein n=1 Tax=Gossypium gossypioides TaxID=34282 RepID=A0A7J9C625_GOSGO|nr:hypothetical protein [Gossypium gossypioides]
MWLSCGSVSLLLSLIQRKTSLSRLSPMERAMVRETMRKMKRDIAMMATIPIAQVAMGNHEMRSGDPTTQGIRGR